jgi:hypothetical protein
MGSQLSNKNIRYVHLSAIIVKLIHSSQNQYSHPRALGFIHKLYIPLEYYQLLPGYCLIDTSCGGSLAGKITYLRKHSSLYVVLSSIFLLKKMTLEYKLNVVVGI